MKKGYHITTSLKGFTLVEIIVTIVAVGILGTIFIHFMGSALDASWNSAELVRDEANSERVTEEIIARYTQLINSNPGNALSTIVTEYNGQTIDGIDITTQYIDFDAGGNEVSAGLSDNLKVVLQAPATATPDISGRYNLTVILANSRAAGDPIILY
jgi:prepilin-type N-terminal cleavage/methylation domain-containing protein